MAQNQSPSIMTEHLNHKISSFIMEGEDLRNTLNSKLLTLWLKTLENDQFLITEKKGLAVFSENELIASTWGYQDLHGETLHPGIQLSLWTQRLKDKIPGKRREEKKIEDIDTLLKKFREGTSQSTHCKISYFLDKGLNRIALEEKIYKWKFTYGKPEVLFFHVLIQQNRILKGFDIVHYENNEIISQINIPMSLQDFQEVKLLSNVEKKILESYIHKNYTEQEVAQHMALSVNTIKTHKQHISKKLNLGTFSQAVAYFQHELDNRGTR